MTLSREINPATLAAIEAAFFFPVILVWLDWPDAEIRVHSGAGVLTHGGEDFAGVGAFGAIRLPQEGAGMASFAADLELVGLPDALDAYLDDPIRGRAGRVWFGAVTQQAGNVLIGDPVEVFSGTMDALRDVVTFTDASGQDVAQRSVRLQLSGGPGQRESASVYHTDEDQKATYPTDTAGRHVLFAEAAAQKLTWPAT